MSQELVYDRGYYIYDAEQSNILKRMITHDFRSFVKVDNVLSLFVSDNHVTKVLTDDDVAKIKAIDKNQGDRVGSDKLLDCLACYRPNWFAVLRGVLRHPDVKQDLVAETFDHCFNKACTKAVEQTVSVQRPPIVEVKADSTSSQGQGHHNTDDDFRLDEDQATLGISETEDDGPDCTSAGPNESPSPECCTTDMPKPKSPDESSAERIHPKDAEETMVKFTEMTLQSNPKMAAPTQEKAESFPYNEGCALVEDTQGSSTASEYEEVQELAGAKAAACRAKPDRGPSETTSCGYENVSRMPASDPGQPRHTVTRRSKDREQPINEFSFAETQVALSGFDGWHTNQSDRNVIYTFRDILEQKKDGHYLVWFWGKKKRPAICVSFKGELITFVIHRRRNKHGGRTNCGSPDAMHVYYIDKNVTKHSLKELFEYHKKNGVVNMKEGPNAGMTIQLRHPIFPEQPH